MPPESRSPPLEAIEILGYASALLIGITLGLLGGGGAIIVVPVLVYLFDKDAETATAYSLFIVSIAALLGFLRNMAKGLVDLKTGLVFAVPAFVATFITRAYIVPLLPDLFFTVGGFEFTKDVAILGLFVVVMLLASVSMIRSKKPEPVATDKPHHINMPLVLAEGLGVGVLTGLIGVGGGFLIVPVLVLLANLSMKKAIGTSLMIIFAKSAIGFAGDLYAGLQPEWTFLLIFAGLAAAGIFVGIWLGTMIPGKKLRKGFGWFVLLMAVYMGFKLTAGV